MLKEQSDYDSFFEDTMKAGHYENDKKSVEIMIKTSPEVVRDLVSTVPSSSETKTQKAPQALERKRRPACPEHGAARPLRSRAR